MKLSNRILKISSYYKDEEHIYDLCCDHGLIGLNIANKALKVGKLKQVLFNDQVKTIIDNIKNKLIDSDIPKDLTLFNNKPAQELKINTKNNLILIAGIGGKLLTDIVKNLSNQNLKQTRIIVSPHNNYWYFRNKILTETNLTFTHETFIKEKNQYYTFDQLEFDQTQSQGRLIPLYFNNKSDKSVQELAKHYYHYFHMAQGDPLRETLLNFFITHYGAII